MDIFHSTFLRKSLWAPPLMILLAVLPKKLEEMFILEILRVTSFRPKKSWATGRQSLLSCKPIEMKIPTFFASGILIIEEKASWKWPLRRATSSTVKELVWVETRVIYYQWFAAEFTMPSRRKLKWAEKSSVKSLPSLRKIWQLWPLRGTKITNQLQPTISNSLTRN